MIIEKAHKRWIDLGNKYSQHLVDLEFIWAAIRKKHSQKNRYYHNLNHIWAMLRYSEDCRKELQDSDAIDFAIWFHDIVYKSTKKDNEERSANFAKKMLANLSIEQNRIDKIYQLIISTKKHEIIYSSDGDNAYLLDFDLSILGQPWEVYENYIQQIRKEYKIYPDLLYKPGRKKVLKSFLDRERLYFTDQYYHSYEEQARKNLEKEIQILS